MIEPVDDSEIDKALRALDNDTNPSVRNEAAERLDCWENREELGTPAQRQRMREGLKAFHERRIDPFRFKPPELLFT